MRALFTHLREGTRMSTTFTPAAALALAALTLASSQATPVRAADTGKLQAVVAEQKSADKAAIVAQQKIDKLSDDTQEMVAKYRQALADTESFKRYTEQLAIQVRAQEEELASIERQLSEIEGTSRDVLPMMQRMVDTLDEFVKLDVPFLPDERTKRVAQLREVLNRADVTISEKYRRILEAYQIEMEYGRTLDSYKGELGEGDDRRTVEFVRVGRVALVYQTLDGNETGYWDQEQKKWIRDDDYRSAVRAALAVAKKEGAPDLLTIPVPSPKEVKS
jgi:hypothetical protein